MAKHVLTDCYVGINGTAISDHVQSVTLEDTADEVEFTSFGPSAYREFGVGLKDANVTITLFQDYAANSMDAIFYPLYQSGGTFNFECRHTSAAASSTNPKYTMVSKLYSYSPISGAVGDANQNDVNIRNAGTAGLVRGTA
jgi:hypothetical protein